MDSKLKMIKILTVSAVVFIFLLVVSLAINLIKISNVSATEAKLTAQIAELDAKIAQNTDDIAELESSEYLDWYAREYLNMKGRDEKVFTFDND